MRGSAAAAALLLALAGPCRAVEVVPMLRLDILGGRFHMDGAGPDFGGNVFWSATAAVKVSGTDSFLPTYSGQYRRTHDTRELVGGGFLTSQTLDNALHLKWVHAYSDAILIKPYFSFKNEMVAETADERLDAGLFNYHKISGGIEFERFGERLRSLRNSFSFYLVRFYNFESLAGERFGDEIKSGSAVLDFNAFDYTLALDWPAWEGGLVSASFSGGYRSFPDQKAVTITGAFSDASRNDLLWHGDLGLQHRWRGWTVGRLVFEPSAGLHAGFSGLSSNQNHYEAARLKFISSYYNYNGLTTGPSVRLKANRVEAGLAYDYDRREYATRPAQDRDGTYLGEKVCVNDQSWTYGVSTALTEFLSLKAQGSYRSSSSNNRYERTYRYNFDARHYFAGISLKY